MHESSHTLNYLVPRVIQYVVPSAPPPSPPTSPDIATVQDGLVHTAWAQRIPLGCRDLSTHLGRLLQASGAAPSTPLTRQQLSAMLAACTEVVEQHEARALQGANGAEGGGAVGRYTLPDGSVLAITDEGKRLGEALVQVRWRGNGGNKGTTIAWE